METLELLKRRVSTIQNLHSVVKTMRALAAVNIRQYERAVEALADYYRTVEMGLQIIIKKSPETLTVARPISKNHVGAIVFGSDQGMCGQLNDQIVSHTINSMDQMGILRENRVLLAVGMRISTRLQYAGQDVQGTLSVPGSVSGITSMVQDILMKIERWHSEKEINQILLFYNKYFGGAYHRPYTVHLLPVGAERFQYLRNKEWPSHVLPIFTMDWDLLFSSLIRQYIFVSLYRAFAESLASENASRLASMQRAEKNISERLDELYSQFHQQRQMSITEELLDIVSGFEALSS